MRVSTHWFCLFNVPTATSSVACVIITVIACNGAAHVLTCVSQQKELWFNVRGAPSE